MPETSPSCSSSFWRGRRVLVTGHTGFKGSWLILWLRHLGAEVSAFALPPATTPSLYELAGPWPDQAHRITDLRDAAAVAEAAAEARPQVVIHMAAQALVRPSYRDPAGTFATNVQGTVNLLEALRRQGGVEACVVVTSDKVYENLEQGRAFVEGDRLGGKDPYSSSKACCELAVQSFRDSYHPFPLATARAGNVVGGGDWSEDRLVPDIVRSLLAGAPVELRYPQAVRPWQHVLEPLKGYLMLAERLATRPDATPTAVNFGPAPSDAFSVAQVVELLGGALGGLGWRPQPGEHPPEAGHLTIDSRLAHRALGWHPRLDARECFRWTAEWYRAWRDGADMARLSLGQIARYEALAKEMEPA